MPLESIRLSSGLPASAARVYTAWLDGAEHARMTGGGASVDPRIGGRHLAWGGYIEGEILELQPESLIVVSWRTSEFPADHPHSRLEIRLRNIPEGCEIILVHTDIPDGQGEKYEAGWQERYINPMTRYFRDMADPPTDPILTTTTAAAAKKAKEEKKPAEAKAAAPKKAAKKAAAKPKKTAKAAKVAAKPKKGAAKAKVASKPKKGAKAKVAPTAKKAAKPKKSAKTKNAAKPAKAKKRAK